MSCRGVEWSRDYLRVNWPHGNVMNSPSLTSPHAVTLETDPQLSSDGSASALCIKRHVLQLISFIVRKVEILLLEISVTANPWWFGTAGSIPVDTTNL